MTGAGLARAPAGRLARWLDERGCAAATRVITDSQANASYFTENLGVPAHQIAPVYVGCDEELFVSSPAPSRSDSRCEVFYYGSFLPLHGTETIVEAAASAAPGAQNPLYPGREWSRFQNRSAADSALGLDNVTLTGWLPTGQLPRYIAAADVCLGGHFSKVPKASRVISTKTFQFVAMRRATVVGDNVATRELFVPGEHVCAVPMADPAALAQAVRRLADDPRLRARLADGGYAVYSEHLTTDAISRSLLAVVSEALCASAS